MWKTLSLLILLVFVSSLAALGKNVRTNLLASQGWALQTPPGDAALQTVSVTGIPGGRAMQVTVSHPTTPFYQIMVANTVVPPILKNDLLNLSFWARSPTGSPMRAAVEEAGAPYMAVMQQTINLKPKWRFYHMHGTIAAPYGASGLAVRLQMGQQVGTVEVADVLLTDLGVNPAIAQAEAATQPAAEQARIWKYRMADLTVQVVDQHGRALPRAQVHVLMTRPAFLFGCNLFDLKFGDHSPQQMAYRSRFAALFNYGTLPFYWGAFEPQQGHPEYSRLDQTVVWAIAHGITPKGHPLIWHQVWPSWAPSTADAAIPLLHQRVTDLVTHYKHLIHYWDVVNEATSADPKTGEGAWIQRNGAAQVVGTALGWARTAGKGARETFLYNDFNTGDQNTALLTRLQKAHQLPDAIGLQSHMFDGTWPMTKLWRICHRFSRFGLPIHFTETTILSGPEKPNLDYNINYTDWLPTPAGEAAQAAYAVKYYTLLFSFPNLRAITWWDLSDKNSWLGAPAGLLRADMTPKPAYNRLMTLIHQTWWTNASGPVSQHGLYKLHAFYGDYRITVTAPNGQIITRTIKWQEDSGAKKVTVVF